jgi:O-acetyl-ADP-ribose deacetylase (regulator of RNase III)
MEIQVGNVQIETTRGDIANQPNVDAIVNAANAQLQTGGGVAGAIHRAAGSGLARECAPQAPIKPGEAVISGGHNLPNRFVIHCLGPVYGKDKPEDKLLTYCYKNALLLADKYEVQTVAFPAISTGIFGYPIVDAARVALNTVKETVPHLKHVRKVRFVLFGESDYEVFSKHLKE